jgi:urea transport system substrate-binding protein
VLHSLSGTMAISETTLKDTMLMLIEQQNAKGGVLGKKLEAVVVDPASDWPLFAEKARELLTVQNVDVMFGCWTSVSRKSVLPVIEELNGLLFYPVQYEGEESSKNVFYTGAAPNQQAIPATDYFLEELGVEKFALLGTDYVYPRTTNNILESYLKDKGIPAEDIFVNYTPFGHSDWSKIVADVVALGADGKKVGVISTINGDANIGFYKELAAAGISADDIPVVAFSVGEEELSGLDTTNLVGHLAAWNYFQSADAPANAEFIKEWKAFAGEERVTNDPMEAHYIGFNMWVNAVEAAGHHGCGCRRDRHVRPEVSEPDRRQAEMLPNHHLTKPVLIGEIQEDGQFDIISQTEPKCPATPGPTSCRNRRCWNRIGRSSAAECTTPRPRPACRSSRTTDLSDPDPERRLQALTALERDPEASHLSILRGAIESETDPAIKARKERLQRLLTIQFGSDQANRVAAIESFAGDPGVDARAALNPLLATRVEVFDAAPEGLNVARLLTPGSDIEPQVAYQMLVDAGKARPVVPMADRKQALIDNIENGMVAGIPVAELVTQAARDRAYLASIWRSTGCRWRRSTSWPPSGWPSPSG